MKFPSGFSSWQLEKITAKPLGGKDFKLNFQINKK
jgi:hypothetical protein